MKFKSLNQPSHDQPNHDQPSHDLQRHHHLQCSGGGRDERSSERLAISLPRVIP